MSQYGRFEKLNKLNYRAWESKVTKVLQSLKAFKIVTREEQAPPNGNTSSNRRLLSAIHAGHGDHSVSVAEELDSHLIGIKDLITM